MSLFLKRKTTDNALGVITKGLADLDTVLAANHKKVAKSDNLIEKITVKKEIAEREIERAERVRSKLQEIFN